MSITNTLATKKVVGAFIAATLAFGLLFSIAAPSAHAALTDSQINSILSLLESFNADQATIDNVETSLRGGTPSGGGGTGSSNVCPFTWTRNLTSGSTGDDVKKLQQFLNDQPGISVASSGVGSPGNETSFYGSLTGQAVKAFQESHTADVLTPVGLSSGTTFFGPSTRAKANSLCTSAPTDGGGDGGGDPAPTGPATLTAPQQPANSLAPDNASRIPFTKFTISAGSSDVTLNSVTVQRIGLGSNSALSGLNLQNENGVLIGNEKTLNSNNQATLGEKYVVKAGTSETFTVVGNMPSDNSSRDGEQLTIRINAVNTNTSLSGNLPITGATHTVNASLSIGSASMSRGSLDPNTSSTQEVGTTGRTFSAVRLTAGSSEDVRIKSIRWDQIGSASAGDLDNVKVVVDGTEYDTTLGSDGDKYTAIFPGDGILVEKGKNKQMSVRADIVSGSDRTIRFDIDKATDIHVVGSTFGFGITPTAGTTGTASNGSSQFTTGTPFYSGSQVTVSAGTLTISSTNDVPAGNIANGADDVSLGSFKFDVRGEPVTWSSIKFKISTSSGTGANAELTNVTLVDGNGNVLAGPEDMTFGSPNTVTLSDSVTIPTGENILILRGNLNDNWSDGDTVQVQLTVSSANLSSLKGSQTGQTITATPNGSTINGKTQTVSGGAFTVTPSGSLVSQTVIGNSSQVTLGRLVLDATNSGEDVRVTVAQIRATTGGGLDVDNLNTIRLYDGNTALNSGSNEVNPSGNAPDAAVNLSFTMDGNGFTVPKGTTKTIDIKANVATTGGTIRFDHSSGSPDWTVTGVNTGNDITETLNTGNGATITFGSAGTLTAALDSSDPLEKWYIPGEQADAAVIEFTSTNENLRLTDLGITRRAASSTSQAITRLSLWSGTTELIAKSNPTFTSTDNGELFSNIDSSATFDVPRDGDKDLTVKVTFADIGNNKPGRSGSIFSIGTTTSASTNKARGLDSGSSVNILGSVGTSTGARVFRGLPIVSADNSNVGTNLSNAQQELYRFKVEAKGNDVAIYKFSFNIATSGVTTTGFKVTEVNTGKLLRASQNDVDSNGDLDVVVNSSSYGSNQVIIPQGQSRTFKVEGTTTGASSGDSITVKLLGDTNFTSATVAAPKSGGVDTLYTAANADSASDDNFIWSPLSTTTNTSTNDWANGFRVPGIEFDDLNSHTRSQ